MRSEVVSVPVYPGYGNSFSVRLLAEPGFDFTAVTAAVAVLESGEYRSDANPGVIKYEAEVENEVGIAGIVTLALGGVMAANTQEYLRLAIEYMGNADGHVWIDGKGSDRKLLLVAVDGSA